MAHFNTVLLPAEAHALSSASRPRSRPPGRATHTLLLSCQAVLSAWTRLCPVSCTSHQCPASSPCAPALRPCPSPKISDQLPPKTFETSGEGGHGSKDCLLPGKRLFASGQKNDQTDSFKIRISRFSWSEILTHQVRAEAQE